MNERDYNGHTPDPDESAPRPDESARGADESLCPYPSDDPRWVAWLEGYLCAVGIIAAQGQAQLEEIARRAT